VRLGVTLSSARAQVAVEIMPVVSHSDRVLGSAVAAEVKTTGALAFPRQQQ